MDQTPNLRLPYLMPAQAQKHVTHNEALRGLDAIVQVGIIDRDLATPPASPSEGDRYIVPTGASGAWAAATDAIAAWQDGAWELYEPVVGWLAWVADESLLLAWDGGAWVEAGGQSLGLLGINTTADTTNRLAVKSDAVLLSHDDVTPGTGDMQVKVNKSLSAKTASALFQVGASGRAEIGLTGDDKLHVKTSADGLSWSESLVIDPATGNVGLGTASPTDKLTIAQGGIVANPGATAAEEWRLTGRTGVSIPVPYLTPTTNNKAIAFDLFPKGAPSDFGATTGVAWMDICSTDIAADGTNYECLRVGKLSGGIGHVGTAKGGTGTVRDLALQMNGGNIAMFSSTVGYGGLGTANFKYVTMYSGADLPIYEFASARADANNTTIGDFEFVNDTNSSGHKRVAAMTVATEGTTANQRGGQYRIWTKPDAGTSITQRLIITQDGNTKPATDNAYKLGISGARWSEVWAANGTIQTSDVRDKDVAARIGGDVAVAMLESVEPIFFKWKNGGNTDIAVATEDDLFPEPVVVGRPGQRLHAGFAAQELKAAMDAAGIDFGAWGLEDKDDPVSRQWTRPDQLIPVLWAALRTTRAEVKALRARTASLGRIP
jgi:hypothetical protein